MSASFKNASPGKPFTGAEYVASLRDEREVYINGERVADVTTHPAFRNSVRSIARLYDALHDPAKKEVLTCPTDTGLGGFTHRYFRVNRSREDLKAAQGAVAAWARLTYGWMGRSPDYKASLTNTFGANPDFYGPYADNARRWYKHAQENVSFINHAIVNPPIDRHKAIADVKDVFIRVEKETDAGVIVSGAKVVATSAAITHYNFMGQTPKSVTSDLDMALSFMVPINTPGLKLFCRTSYEQAAHAHGGGPFDYPLSSRFDENDAILVMDKVLIPWENVLIYRDPERVSKFMGGSGFLNGYLFQGCTRFAVKLDFIAGLLAKALHATGGDEFRGNQALLGEVVAWRHLFWSLSDAMASNPDPWKGDAVLPERKAALSYCVFAPECYPRVKEIVHRTVASGLIYLPSSTKDFTNPAIEPFLKQYVRGSNDIGHVERIKIMKLLWDAVGTEFAGRNELYERNYAGAWEDIRLQVAAEADRSGKVRAMKDLVDECLADYDESGWVNPAWKDPSTAVEEAPPLDKAA
jgi:4-hydroxyphenylacetate 3-monooxygenase